MSVLLVWGLKVTWTWPPQYLQCSQLMSSWAQSKGCVWLISRCDWPAFLWTCLDPSQWRAKGSFPVLLLSEPSWDFSTGNQVSLCALHMQSLCSPCASLLRIALPCPVPLSLSGPLPYWYSGHPGLVLDPSSSLSLLSLSPTTCYFK